METPLLELLRCPFCRSSLAETDGSLACGGCGRTFAIEKGIPLMLHEDLPAPARSSARRSAGSRRRAPRAGTSPTIWSTRVLPFVNRELGWNDLVWLANGHSFQVLLDRYVGDLRGLRVLEVGAAKAWAARYWLERECEFVATDILVDEKIGLGRGAFYGEFGRVQADGEHLPFGDDTFDVVYCCATLHHALDLRRMVAEMARVARPGAVVAGLNEGTRGVGRSPENPRPGVGEGGRHQRARAHRVGLPRSVRPRGPARAPARTARRLGAVALRAAAVQDSEGRPLGRDDHAPERGPLLRCLGLRAEAGMNVYADLLRYRELFGNLFRRDLQAKYRGSALGVLWTVVNPIMLMGVYLLVFSVVWKSPFAGGGHYPLFLLSGLAVWTSSPPRCSRRRGRCSTTRTSSARSASRASSCRCPSSAHISSASRSCSCSSSS